MFLSIMVPSKRPDGLDKFLASLKKHTADITNVQVVTLVDDEDEYIEFHGSDVEIHYPPGQTAAKMMEECYKLTKGDWIMFGNDDITMETSGWDAILWDEVQKYPDQIALFWPDDNMFKEKLSCFPILSRRVIDLVGLFPLPYKQYKIDDTIFEIFPPNRRIYLPQIKINHKNDEGEEGFQLPDGRIYPINRNNAVFDNEHWMREAGRRERMRHILRNYMDPENRPGTRVLIGVPTQEFAKQAQFYDYFNLLEKPNGTMITFAHGQSPARNRNLIVQQAIENNCSHVFFLDDDTLVPHDALIRLLAHDKDIVTGLYLMRNYPHRPVIFDKAEPNGACTYRYLDDDDKGLIEVVAAGLGCCLIKTSVFRRLEPPWIRLGQLESDQWCDDIEFFKRVREAEIKIYCDLDVTAKHMATVAISPNRINGKWHVTYDTNGEGTINAPMVNPHVTV